jgi:hypothetical protein
MLNSINLRKHKNTIFGNAQTHFKSNTQNNLKNYVEEKEKIISSQHLQNLNQFLDFPRSKFRGR